MGSLLSCCNNSENQAAPLLEEKQNPNDAWFYENKEQLRSIKNKKLESRGMSLSPALWSPA